MIPRTLSLKLFSCLVLFLLFAASRTVANTVDVYWDSLDGFSTGGVTINAGDEVDVANLDTGSDMYLTWTDPANWYSDVPPSPGSYYYYVPIVFNTPGTYFVNDQFGDYFMVTVNSTAPPPPLSVTITAPTNNAAFTVPGAFTITAAPSGGTSPYQVDFYVGTNHTGVASGSPYNNAVNNLAVGSYNVSAIVTDNNFNTATNSIQVIVQPLLVTNYILPVACADIYSSGSVLTGSYLDADENDHGTLEFAGFNASQCVSIQLEVNPYGEPLFGPQVTVTGFDGGNGTLYSSNYNSGTVVGVYTLPPGLNYGQVTTFDVTAFVKSTKGPYFGLSLSAGGDLFSSTSINYGLPPELYAISPAPPPPPAIARLGNKFIISWSTFNALGATLETSPTIGPNANWVPVNLTPALVNGQWVVTNSVSGASQFFRLAGQ